MSFKRKNVRRAVKDRLSGFPDEVIHRILSCLDMKFAVQTCLPSSRWKLLWTAMPCLNFSNRHFRVLRKFAEFVTHVLSHRNHQIQVSSVKLDFHGAANQVFVTQIANYAFSHNVQELTVANSSTSQHVYPPCLFSSPSLKHFRVTCNHMQLYTTTKTPLNFPVLTTLHISGITLCNDLFTKCVNLKNLTLERFLMGVEGLSSLCYTDTGLLPWNCLLQFSNDRFHPLNKVTLSLSYHSTMPYKKKDVCKTINLLQVLQSARYLTLNPDIVECISSYSDLLSQHPSPFSNLICLTIDYSMRKNAYKVNLSSEARKFLLENSASATFIMELPKVRSRR